MEQDIVKQEKAEAELISPPTREDLLVNIANILSDLKAYENMRIKDPQKTKLRLEVIRLELKAISDANSIIGSAENSALYGLLRDLKDQSEQPNEEEKKEEESRKLNAVLDQLIEINKKG